MKTWKIIAILVIYTVVVGTLGVYYDYCVSRDTTAWLNRAQVSSNPEDMKEFLINARDGMNKWGCSEGYAALVFKKPDNDMLLIRRALDRTIERAKQLESMDIHSVSYQTGLDDLRGTIRELDFQAEYFWFIHRGMLLFIALWGLMPVWIIPLTVKGILWQRSPAYEEYYEKQLKAQRALLYRQLPEKPEKEDEREDKK